MSTQPPRRSDTPAERLALARADQFRRWRRGERVGVEELLQRWPGLDSHGVVELICQEVLFREDGGEAPSAAEYQRRFPRCATAIARRFALHHALEDVR